MTKFVGKTVEFDKGTANRLKVPEGAKDVQQFDSKLRGFGLRRFAPSPAFPKGKISFFVKFVVKGQTKQRRVTLGEATGDNLKAMREKANEILTEGKMRQGHRGRCARAGPTKQVVTLGQVIPPYLKSRATELRERSYVETERYLRRSWKPLHPLDVCGITRANVVAVLDGIEAASGSPTADRAKAALSSCTQMPIDRSFCEASPCLNIRARAQGGGRTRVLTEPELVLVWTCCADDDFGRIVKLLLLTGQRRSEIGDLRWSEVDLARRQIQLPERRTKNKRAHIIPLSDEALALLPERGEEREFVFGPAGFANWSAAKGYLDARIAKACKGKPIPPFTLHDLRAVSRPSRASSACDLTSWKAS